MPDVHAQEPAARPGSEPQPAASAGLEFRSLLDAAVDAIIVIDHGGRIEQFSLAAERIFGYEQGEILGQNVHVLMPEPYHGEHDRYMDRYQATGEARIIGIGREVRARRKDGSIFPCELAVGEVQGAVPRRFIGFIRDISLRKLAEERLRRSEAELRLAQELANLGNYVVHLDGSEPDYYSPQLCRILGVDLAHGSASFSLLLERWVHPADREKLERAIAELDLPAGTFDVEYRVVLQDGTLRHLHHIAQLTRDAHGAPLKHVGTIHDITDRRQTEDEARQLQERLTHFARLSTMGEMAAGLAHEINQPLAAIATYAQACQRFVRSPSRDDSDVLEALAQINAQALRAGEVIRRLRNFVKNREVKREPVDCNRLLDDLRTLADTDARLHNIHLRVEERARPAAGLRRPDPAAAGGAEPGAQRDRRHGGRAPVTARSAAVDAAAAGGRGGDHRRGPRQRSRTGSGRAPVQPVFHDEIRRHGPRARHQPLDRARPRRTPVAHSQ